MCDRGILLRNLNRIADEMHAQGRIFAAVSKGVCAEEHLVELIDRSRCDWIADSKIDNLAAAKTKKTKFLIRITQPSEVREVIRFADISFQSEIATIRLLGREAGRLGKRHGVIVALDLGDLREGIFFDKPDEMEAVCRAVLEEPSLELIGVGTNLGCFGGIKTTPDKLELLKELSEELERRLCVKFKYVSGLTTASQKLLFQGDIPPRINHGRFGEAWLTAFDSVDQCEIPELEKGAFTLAAQIAEAKIKPSKPVGEVGGDAFGNVVVREDKGPMYRGIVDCGMQDVDLASVRPRDPRVKVIGGSSDHMIVDLSAAPEYALGDTLSFDLSYGAIMRAFTGKYIYKEFI